MNMEAIKPKRYVDLGFLGVGLCVFLVARQVFGLIWDYFRLPLFESLVVPFPDILAVFSGLIVFLLLRRNQRAVEFSQEVVMELSKVTWPVKKETLLSSVIVVIMVGIASLLLVIVDSIWVGVTHTFLQNK